MTVRLRISPSHSTTQVPPNPAVIPHDHPIQSYPTSVVEDASPTNTNFPRLNEPPSSTSQLSSGTVPVPFPKPEYMLPSVDQLLQQPFIHDKLFISPNQRPPKHEGSPSLTIDVQRANTKDKDTATSSASSVRSTVLQDAVSLERSNSSSSINFDKITQLPTPIINNGSFCLFPPPEMSLVTRQRNNSLSPPMQSQTITIPKHPHGNSNTSNGGAVPSDLHMTSTSSRPSRVFSEYRPTPVVRKNSLLDNINERHSTRVASNPGNASFLSSSPASVLSGATSASASMSASTSYPVVVLSVPLSITEGIYQAPRLHTFYQFIEVLGSGNFSNVVLAVNPKDSDDMVVVKIISIPANNKAEISNFRSFIKRELNILNLVRHPSIITLLDYNINLSISSLEILDPNYEDSDTESDSQDKMNTDMQNLRQNSQQFIFLNYCRGGNLFEFAKDNYAFNNLAYWLVVKRVVSELIFAVAYLHNSKIVHRDLKLENILLNYEASQLFNFAHLLNHPECTQPIIALTDFGLSKRLQGDNDQLSTRCGSQDYVSPELLMGLKYDGKLTDSWSLGVLIYALLENRLPFDAPPVSSSAPSTVSPSVLKRRRTKNKAAHRIAMIDWGWFKTEELLVDDSVDEQVKSIVVDLQLVVKRLLVRKEKRPRLNELLEDPDFAWFTASVPPSMYD